jgi:hypothetical protein
VFLQVFGGFSARNAARPGAEGLFEQLVVTAQTKQIKVLFVPFVNQKDIRLYVEFPITGPIANQRVIIMGFAHNEVVVGQLIDNRMHLGKIIMLFPVSFKVFYEPRISFSV